MVKFRIRYVNPNPLSDVWGTVDANDVVDAVSRYHADTCDSTYWKEEQDRKFWVRPDEDRSPGESVHFAEIEVEGETGTFLSRTYAYKIVRRGGVKPNRAGSLEQHLQWIADRIGWKEDPSLLLVPGWEGEEKLK